MANLKYLSISIILMLLFVGFNVSSIKINKDGDWPIDLIGLSSISVPKDKYESWVDLYESCWSDGDHTWCGVPLWMVVAMVDDPEPEDHTFNDTLAAQGYTVRLTAWDGWVTELDISLVAYNDEGYIVANTIDGEELPEYTPGGHPSYPLHLRGSDVFPPNNVGGVIKIELVGISGNNPPDIPEIDGTTKGRKGIEYKYDFSTDDPEENNVYYYIDWGDNTNSGWYGPYTSGSEKSLSHTWEESGVYVIKIKAKDTFGEESDWNTLEVSMPKKIFSNNLIFCKLFKILKSLNLFLFLNYAGLFD